ncbi:MAG: response regulator transcription factor [Elusimicrobia bacterium]|nr:response regulator transcription factor [Elusimicrobiota bacterium]
MNKSERLHIAVVEDDRRMSFLIESVLNEEGFNKINICRDISESFNYLRQNQPDIMILDLKLPDGNGIEILKYVRKTPDLQKMPVIVLTGDEDLATKKLVFDAEADIYLTKPIDCKELILWINSIFRRLKESPYPDDSCIVVDSVSELKIDKNQHLAHYKGELIENLTNREFDLFFALVRHSPHIFSRKDIIEKIWKTCSVENLADIHLHNLKKKLPAEISRKITAVTGKGFRYISS